MEAMVKTIRLLGLAEMEAIAKDATYAALIGYIPPSDEEEAVMTLGTICPD